MKSISALVCLSSIGGFIAGFMWGTDIAADSKDAYGSHKLMIETGKASYDPKTGKFTERKAP